MSFSFCILFLDAIHFLISVGELLLSFHQLRVANATVFKHSHYRLVSPPTGAC